MGKNARKRHRDMDFDPFDDFDDMYDDELDSDDLSRDIFSTEWGNYSDADDHSDARRKIERRRDMKRLHSQLNDWEEYGEQDNW